MNPIIKNNLLKIQNERLFSFSRLSIIETCLLQFFFKYVLEIQEESGLPLHFGKATHKAIEEYAKGDDEKTALLKGLEEVQYYPIPINDYVRMLVNAKRFIEQGIAKKNSNIELEYHFTFELGDGIKLQGFVDVLQNIGGVYRFIDWKTNRIMYEANDTFQLALYALALKILKNANYVSGELIFLRFYRKNRKYKAFENRDMEKARNWALHHAKRGLKAVDDALQGQPLDKAFPVCMSSKCAHCPFADLCITVEKEGLERLFNEPVKQ